MNEIEIQVNAQQNVSAEFDDMGSAVRGFGQQTQRTMADTEEAFDTAARNASTFGAALDKAAGFGDNLSAGIQGVGDTVGSVNDMMNYGSRRALEYAQAQQDVEQATEDAAQANIDLRQATRDAAQATIDGKQAALDMEQARLDQAEAQKELNKAIKEHGRNSAEAKQAEIDLKQAGIDLAQANEDQKQSVEDLRQAQADDRQAKLDSKQAAIDLAAAQSEMATQSSKLTQISEWAGMLSGAIGGLVGIIGAVTAVQWAWNASLLANPIVLIIAAIVALVAIIVIIATKTDWFQRLWHAIWSKIGDPVKAVIDFIKSYYEFLFRVLITAVRTWWRIFTTAWKTAIDFAVRYVKFILDIPGKIKNAFSKMGQWISAPFRSGFNAIARAWNSTVGRLHWSIPGWVPGIGGRSISAPNIPTLQRGGEILNTGIAMVHRGERIIPAHTRGLPGGSNGGNPTQLLVSAAPGSERAFLEWLLEKIAMMVRTEGQGSASYLGIKVV